MGDISGYFPVGEAGSKLPGKVNKSDDNLDLNMQDFLTLMVTELQSQTIDSTADTSEMLNQMVMMQMVSALTNMTDASIMSYAASLVGKTVTVGQFDSDGKLQEVVGTVTATGTMNGQQVVFVDDKYYYMNEIMAVGTLPKQEKPDEKPDETEPGDPDNKVPSPDETDPEDPNGPEETPEEKIPDEPGDEVTPPSEEITDDPSDGINGYRSPVFTW